MAQELADVIERLHDIASPGGGVRYVSAAELTAVATAALRDDDAALLLIRRLVQVAEQQAAQIATMAEDVHVLTSLLREGGVDLPTRLRRTEDEPADAADSRPSRVR